MPGADMGGTSPGQNIEGINIITWNCISHRSANSQYFLGQETGRFSPKEMEETIWEDLGQEVGALVPQIKLSLFQYLQVHSETAYPQAPEPEVSQSKYLFIS